MAIEFSDFIPFARDEVWRRFAAPGGITRLLPGFSELRVLKEARLLSSGSTVLCSSPPSPLSGSPLLPKWVAKHDPSAFLEGKRFMVHVRSAPYGQLFSWTHEHLLEDAPGGTKIIDILSGRVPQDLLAPALSYRTVQLREDLRALHRAREFSARLMTVAITGSSGLIGTQLTAWLTSAGHRVIKLVRGAPKTPDERHWDPDDPDPKLLAGVDGVVHLAGQTIAGRFSEKHKQALRDSRVRPTRLLAQLAVEAGTVFVSASAIGFYGADRGEQVLDEQAEPGDDFLAELVRDWEQAAQLAADRGVRAVQIRTGLVLAGAGGMLGVLAPKFRLCLGGEIGHGQQWHSWIALDDVVDIYVRALLDENLSGPVNAVAPNPVRNAQYTREVGKLLHRPTALRVPAFVPALVLGTEGAEQLALANQRVAPSALTSLGHVFRFPHLADALRHELGSYETWRHRFYGLTGRVVN